MKQIGFIFFQKASVMVFKIHKKHKVFNSVV